MKTKCPVCTDDHPTGRFRQTWGDLEHQSRECGHLASRMGVTAVGLLDPRRRDLLQAAKRDLEGSEHAWCERCGSLTKGARLCDDHVEFWGDADDLAQRDAIGV